MIQISLPVLALPAVLFFVFPCFVALSAAANQNNINGSDISKTSSSDQIKSVNKSSIPDSRLEFIAEPVATNLRVPWSIAIAPGNRILFTEREGRLRVIRNGSLQSEPLFKIDDVDATGKLGLMSIALHPDFETIPWVYLSYSYRDSEGPKVRVARYHETSQTLTERTVIVENIPAATNHAGCRIQFGPDRKLYVTTGDADLPELAQDVRSLAGKILRLEEDGAIPSDNPFVDQKGARREIWSYGHRNSQGLDWHPVTGLLFESEHGPTGGDEINIIEAGKNYGWPKVHHRQSSPDSESPLIEFTPSVAPASGMFYQGAAFPQLQGDFLVGCLRGEGVLRIQTNGRRVTGIEWLIGSRYGRIRDVAEAPDGTIYISTSMYDPPESATGGPGYDMILRLSPKNP